MNTEKGSHCILDFLTIYIIKQAIYFQAKYLETKE